MPNYKLINDDCINVKIDNISLIYLDPPYSYKQEDIYYGLGKTQEEYLSFIHDRLVVMKSWMKPNANIVLHADWKNIHYIKVMMDKIFGIDNFRNEIVWCYTGPSVAKRYFPRKHDTLLWYGIGEYTFNPQRIPYQKGLRVGGNTGWNEKKDTAEYLGRGKLLEDWWTDVASLNRNNSEKTGYKTQKPIKLLNRIIDSLSNEGDIVVDPFVGSGTTIMSALDLNRDAIGIDININAINIIKNRIIKNRIIKNGRFNSL